MTDFHGTWLQELVKNLILSGAGAGIGLVVYLACTNAKAAWNSHGWRRRLHISYFFARIGFAGTLILVGWRVYNAHVPIPLDFITIAYTIFLLMATGGYAGVVIERRHEKLDREDKRSPANGDEEL